MQFASPSDDNFQLSDADRQVLDGMAGQLEEGDPALAAKLTGEQAPGMSTRAKLAIVAAVAVLLLAMLAAMSHMVLYGSPATEAEETQTPVAINTASPYEPLNP